MLTNGNLAANWPATWPTDGRDGGVPDPALAGPEMIQIGTEGGFLPAPVVLPNTPIGYNYNRRDIVVLNVENKTLFMGPAERADVIIDFSQVPANAGITNIILYSDAPAPVPAFDTRYDYYTGDPDQTDTGGAPTTAIGKGPNTRTIMQFRVAAGSPGTAFNLVNLQDTATGLPHAFATSQDPPVVPQAAYSSANGGPYPTTYTDTMGVNLSRISDTSLTFAPFGSGTPTTVAMQPKAIQELFETNYGRMNATLGVELPFTNANNQTTIPFGYIDPPTETISGNQTQIWKITHNGVDTHAIHFHLFNVQLINRVGWDGAIRPPDANELGWKETVRMNPLEDAIVAMKPVAPVVPFAVPNSVRLLDPTQLPGATMNFWPQGPTGLPVTTTNVLTDFGWEYVWHCHLLGHEENDMMRPIVFHP
jgi:FtsP/CotA-like multicopper oxidase with cupredoxin domain